jgi:hypothetical protein
MRFNVVENSLVDVLSNSPEWWTPTAGPKAVVRIAPGIRFFHGLGLRHQTVKLNDIPFDADLRIQIPDFSLIRLAMAKGGRPRQTFLYFPLFFLKSHKGLTSSFPRFCFANNLGWVMAKP